MPGGREGGRSSPYLMASIRMDPGNESRSLKQLGSGADCSQPESTTTNRKMLLPLAYDTTGQILGIAKDLDCILNTNYIC